MGRAGGTGRRLLAPRAGPPTAAAGVRRSGPGKSAGRVGRAGAVAGAGRGYNGGVNPAGQTATDAAATDAAPLAGRTAIVTGAAVRLGRAIALGLADAGADVLVHYGSHEEQAEEVADLIRATGRRAATVRADLADPLPAAEAIFAAASKFGGADVLVNNAAIFEPCAFEEVDAAHWDRHLAIDLKAPFFLAQRFAAQFRGDAGSVVNVLCRRATRPEAEDLPYTAAKAGLLALTKGLALKLAPAIRVNGVAPGAMLPPTGRDDAPDSWADRKAPEVPLKRVGGADPVARAVRYLCEAEFVTGEVIHVAGGEQL